MTTIEQLAGVQIYQVLNDRLTNFDHLCRDLEYALVLSGANNDTLSLRLMAVRRAIEFAATLVREA